ncbi:MAG TPA: hypothetical protein PKD49_03815 [Hyphomicrobium sp.]|nr:hypothetical protein [Hyphomicrobium sp.]
MRTRTFAVILAAALTGCADSAPIASAPNPDGKHEQITDPWERVGQTLQKK